MVKTLGNLEFANEFLGEIASVPLQMIGSESSRSRKTENSHIYFGA